MSVWCKSQTPDRSIQLTTLTWVLEIGAEAETLEMEADARKIEK